MNILNLLTTVAYAAEGTAQVATDMPQPSTAGAMLQAFLPMVIVIVLLYFMMIRPQKKRDKE